MGTGQNRTHMIFVSDDQKLIVTTNVSSGTVTFVTSGCSTWSWDASGTNNVAVFDVVRGTIAFVASAELLPATPDVWLSD